MGRKHQPITVACTTDRCELCGTSDDRLVCDHDVQTDLIRGWICQRCNTGLGMFGDGIEGLLRAITYLERPRSGALWTQYRREQVMLQQRALRVRRGEQVGAPEWEAWRETERRRGMIKQRNRRANESLSAKEKRLAYNHTYYIGRRKVNAS
jgi:hypothetical protein